MVMHWLQLLSASTNQFDITFFHKCHYTKTRPAPCGTSRLSSACESCQNYVLHFRKKSECESDEFMPHLMLRSFSCWMQLHVRNWSHCVLLRLCRAANMLEHRGPKSWNSVFFWNDNHAMFQLMRVRVRLQITSNPKGQKHEGRITDHPNHLGM